MHYQTERQENNAIFRILSVIIVAMILLSSCGKSDPPDKKSSEDTLVINESIKVIRADEDDTAVEGIRYLREVLKDLYGFSIASESDFIGRNETVDPDEYVIILGKTNRQASVDLMSDYAYGDYGYYVPDDHTVVIGGMTSESILQAVKQFCMDIFGTNGDNRGEAKEIPVGTSFRYTASYPISNLTVNGTPIEKFTVVYSGNYFEYADRIVKKIADLTGKLISAEKSKNYSGDYAIRLTEGKNSSVYSVYSDGNDIVLEGYANGIDLAYNYFVNNCIGPNIIEKPDISVPDRSHIGFTFEEKTSGFTEESREDSVIREGVTQSIIHYKDRDGYAHVAYIVCAEPGTVRLEMGLPNASDELNGLQKVYKQAVAAEEKLGYDIVAAVNADLFSFSTELPNGLTVYNGKLLCEDSIGYQGFALLNDGTYRFANNNNELKQYLPDIKIACGGRYLLMKSGKIVDNGEADPFCTTRHPRTAFGYKKDGTLIFVAVDGRQAGYSDGAMLLDLSQIFCSLGAYEAINLDGGGSTNLYVKDYKTGDFVCINKPCETNPFRSVVNTLFFVWDK